MKLQYLHLGVGALGLIAFAVQGQFMEGSIAVSNLPDGPRMMYRTAHLYLMLASVINILMALAPPRASGRWSHRLYQVVGLVFLISPLMFGLSFVYESTQPDLMRPLAVFTLYGVFGGGVLMTILALSGRFEGRP